MRDPNKVSAFDLSIFGIIWGLVKIAVVIAMVVAFWQLALAGLCVLAVVWIFNR